MTELVEEIKAIIDMEGSGTWTAATLWTENFRVSFDTYKDNDAEFGANGQKTTNDEERYLYSKLYVKIKTSTHSYYDKCLEVIRKFEENMDAALGVE